jgi:hypothetical protein
MAKTSKGSTSVKVSLNKKKTGKAKKKVGPKGQKPKAYKGQGR